MTLDELDFFFPIFVLAYGLLLTFVLHSEGLMKLAETRLPRVWFEQMGRHRALALVALVVGTLWTLQNLWLS